MTEATMRLTMPSDREIRMTRWFDAPRARVFDAYTRPELVRRWLWARECPMIACEIDLRVGGAIRYVWRMRDGGEMGVNGVFREIVPNERLVHTEIFDQDWTGGETVVTTLFTEEGGRTEVAMTVLYASTAARDGAAATGMAGGVAEGLDKLDALLAEKLAGEGA